MSPCDADPLLIHSTGLTLVAESEYAVNQFSKSRSTADPSVISKYLTPLSETIVNRTTYAEDEFQAQVCLAWIHWTLKELELARDSLPSNIESSFSLLDGSEHQSTAWTRISAIKGAFIKGTAQAKTRQHAEAFETFDSSLPLVTPVSSASSSEARYWTEIYLTNFCMLSAASIRNKLTPRAETETLAAFRTWSKFWTGSLAQNIGGRHPEADIPRRRVWREFYLMLSKILQSNLPYPTTALTTSSLTTSTRLQQRAELKRVEATYESLLLAETPFPEASQTSEEVEFWTDVVIQNWRILCGNDWYENDLGEGGREAVSRGVLDILYRAATKTFHSTRVLRHLFTVHLAVAEFDLAFKAFDTYMEIVERGRARVEKTAEPEQGLDDDETVTKAICECIRARCRYGSRQGVERAKDLGIFLQEWLDKHYPYREAPGDRLEDAVNYALAPPTFAKAWQAIGISQATWARYAFEASVRSEFQAQAVKSFKKSLSQQFQSSNDIDTLFALALLLAEQKQLTAAVGVVKTALLPPKDAQADKSNEFGPGRGDYSRQRSLIPLWHLLALLLSAKQEFTTAARACEGAFEQFNDPINLFGEKDGLPRYRSDHLNEKSGERRDGVVDFMDDFEKETVLEVKMTQLALLEVLEGPEVAVNASDELLSLYSRLFGDPEDLVASSTARQNLRTPPKSSSASTIRSIRGSIFGRSHRAASKPARASILDSSPISEKPEDGSEASAESPKTTRTPTIQVTNENGAPSKQSRHRSLREARPHLHLHRHDKDVKRSKSLPRKKSEQSVQESNNQEQESNLKPLGTQYSTGNEPRAPDLEGSGDFYTPSEAPRSQWLEDSPEQHRLSQVGLAMSPEFSSSPFPPHSEKTGESPASNQSSQPIARQMHQKEKTLRIPSGPHPGDSPDLPHISPSPTTANPMSRFPKEQERRRRVGVMIKVWLLVAAFYRRATMYDDAKGAIDEARSLILGLEHDVIKDTSGLVTISNAGWGGGKSVEHLWADILAEVSLLTIQDP